MNGPNASDGAILPPLPMGDGKLAENIAHFARVLRRAGLRTSPQSTMDAVEAVQAIGLGSTQEFKAILAAIFVKRREDIPVFDEAFGIFWRRRDLVEKMIEARKVCNNMEDTRTKAIAYQSQVKDAFFDDIRYHVDKLELLVDDREWDLPKYREMLFLR